MNKAFPQQLYTPTEWRSQFDLSQETLTWDYDGEEYNRMPHIGQNERCTGCAVPIGTLHIFGCSEEICPNCNGAFTACPCHVCNLSGEQCDHEKEDDLSCELQ